MSSQTLELPDVQNLSSAQHQVHPAGGFLVGQLTQSWIGDNSTVVNNQGAAGASFQSLVKDMQTLAIEEAEANED